MSTPSTSLVSISKETVLAAATAMLVAVEASRKAEREKTIAEVQTHRLLEWRPWPLWFRRRKLTREEAIEKVDAQWIGEFGGRNPHSWWRIRGWGTKQLAERLQAATRLSADGTVWLNLEDAEEVAQYVPSVGGSL